MNCCLEAGKTIDRRVLFLQGARSAVLPSEKRLSRFAQAIMSLSCSLILFLPPFLSHCYASKVNAKTKRLKLAGDGLETKSGERVLLCMKGGGL